MENNVKLWGMSGKIRRGKTIEDCQGQKDVRLDAREIVKWRKATADVTRGRT